MRGKPSLACPLMSYIRITPADAGKTAKKRIRRRYTRDHPRGCGENLQHFTPRLLLGGSPPRMRGKQGKITCPLMNWRITPADAGKTTFIRFTSLFLMDHPRGCGENSVLIEPLGCLPGSPPRMRGKQFGCSSPLMWSRITPADAGKTRNTPHTARQRQDHPRGCGENQDFFSGFGLTAGSPPRMRGKPASVSFSGRMISDHPRGCGENYEQLVGGVETLGSPPRMRGKPRRWCYETSEYRITPADAGKTSKDKGRDE